MVPLALFGASSVRCGDGVVTLDFDTDTYSCRYDPVDHEDAAAGEPLTPSWRDAADAKDRLEAGDRRLYLRAWRAALPSFIGRPIRSLMITALDLETEPVRRSDATTQDLAARFERMSLYLPFRAPCLLRAYVLLHYLSFYGRQADWVIGVQLFPFRAHCWLAIDDLLIAERVHLIEDYAPIFRLRRS